jgi:hypothetical protein
MRKAFIWPALTSLLEQQDLVANGVPRSECPLSGARRKNVTNSSCKAIGGSRWNALGWFHSVRRPGTLSIRGQETANVSSTG